MSQFQKDNLEMFLGAVRKYMQVRGPFSQKELADLTGIGESTMSRFMSMKTQDINPQLVAKLVARLDIPLHEIIDFVDESFSDQFIRLVKFYQGDDPVAKEIEKEREFNEHTLGNDTKSGGSAQKQVGAKITVGGKTHTILYAPNGNGTEEDDKEIFFAGLSAYQKAFMTNFLNLESERKDLVVDIGNNLIRYFQKKGL